MTSNSRALDESDVPTLRVRGPADLVQAIPYLLGFHPVQSLVLVGLASGRVVVTARLDLADTAEPGMLEHSVAGMHRGGAHDFVGFVYDDDAMPRPGNRDCDGVVPAPLPYALAWSELAADLTDLVAGLGATMDDVVLVSRQRFWSYLCAEPMCCPPEGTAVVSNSTVAATATYAGLVALPDRASLERQLDPLPAAQRERLLPQLELGERDAVAMILRREIKRADRSAVRALFAAGRESDAPGSAQSLTDDDVVRFAVALQRYAVRDSLWLAVDDGRIEAQPLWRDLARRLPAPYDAPALFLFAWQCYRDGNGALAGIAANQALESDPGYSAADLLLAALSHAVDPRQLPKLRSRRPA